MSKQKALECLEAAKKAENKTSFFGAKKPDYETALTNYTEASNILKSLKEYPLAVEATLKLAETHKAMDAQFMAAKAFETAANMMQLNLNQSKESASVLETASNLYLAHGSPERAADCLEKCARSLETSDATKALEKYTKCLDIIDSSDSPRSGVDSFKRAIQFCIRIKTWESALSFSKRLVQLFKTIEQKHYMNRQALSCLIICLINKDMAQGKDLYSDYLTDLMDFGVSEEGKVASELLDCPNKEEWDQLKKSNAVKYLDNELLKQFLATDFVSESHVKQEQVKDLQNQIEEEGFL